MKQKPPILYVDDEPINLLLFKNNFKDAYNVFVGNCAQEGLKVLESHKEIDLVISDMKMPGMDGLEFIETAKKRYPQKKFFIFTGLDISEKIKAAEKSGLILQYFRKPLEYKKMDTAIKDAIKT
ncbi:MAG: response regulator [Flavobacteriaceae bacterium]|nr:response regulator [Flavobacteriaceae bacterium]